VQKICENLRETAAPIPSYLLKLAPQHCFIDEFESVGNPYTHEKKEAEASSPTNIP
jgi:hypothetical protein